MATDLFTKRERDDGTSAVTNQFLTFSLESEEYGVDILKVQEIKGYVPTTRIPNSPHAIHGVLNLRGTVVPIVDLRCKFGMEAIAYDPFTAIVVVVVKGRIMGMIVDRVSEVMSIPADDIQPPPDGGSDRAPGMLQGIARVGEKLIILLDVDAVLVGADDEMDFAA